MHGPPDSSMQQGRPMQPGSAHGGSVQQHGSWPVFYRHPGVGQPSPNRGQHAVWRQAPAPDQESLSSNRGARISGASPASSATVPALPVSAVPPTGITPPQAMHEQFHLRHGLQQQQQHQQQQQPVQQPVGSPPTGQQMPQQQQTQHHVQPPDEGFEAFNAGFEREDQNSGGMAFDAAGADGMDCRQTRSQSSAAQAFGAADRARSADVLTSRVDEALMRLRLRVDEAIVELRAELPRARKERERQQADLERVAQEQMRSTASCIARIQSLEQTMANASGVRSEREEAQSKMIDELGKSLAEETEARIDLERALGKDLREHVALEVEGTREMAMREMRERMDGQKVLREEVQLQQQALLRLNSRLDEALVELRTEIPRLAQEHSSQKGDTDKIVETVSSSLVVAFDKKLADSERGLRHWAEAKFQDQEAVLQGWVESTVVGRVDSLDKALRKEMSERAAAIQQVLDRVSHNSERWNQLQAKFDELLIEVL